MAHQPGPPTTRQSAPPAKPAPKTEGGAIPHGGPIQPNAQGYRNPGATPNLRGVEPNTEMHKGTPNPEQHGTHKNREDHNPGMAQAGDTHRPHVPVVLPVKDRHSNASTKVPPPMPDPMGVRK